MTTKRSGTKIRNRNIDNSVHDSMNFWIGAGIFALALLVRLVYLFEMSGSPTFSEPIIDSQVYDKLARMLAGGEEVGMELFWQPFFYPFFLSKVYSLFGGSIISAKIIQMFVGAFTCVIAWRIGLRAAGRRVGIIAGIIAALYGPLVFFEGELLATGWAAFWSAAYAETGRFDDAVRTARQALDRSGITTPEKIQKRILYALELFKKEKPFRLDQSQLNEW